jgi:hypothetical protein
MNQTEQKIIELGNQYIIYMLTINDEDKIIYSKLLELDDGELEHFIFGKLKSYLWNEEPYCEDEDENEEDDKDEDEDEDEDENEGVIVSAYTIKDFVGIETEMDYTDIFNNYEELIELQKMIITWVQERSGIEPDLTEYGNLVEEYLYHYFSDYGDMDANEVKEYIINLIDPVELK